jgi:hypothetical protein
MKEKRYIRAMAPVAAITHMRSFSVTRMRRRA